jgi:hypothetical protein
LIYHPKYEIYNAQIKLDNREHQVLQIKSNPHFAGEIPKKLTTTAFHMLLHPCSPNQSPATFFLGFFHHYAFFVYTTFYTTFKTTFKTTGSWFQPL